MQDDYRVVTAHSLRALVARVCQAQRDGWEAVGGVTLRLTQENIDYDVDVDVVTPVVYLQAMVLVRTAVK